MCVPVCVLTYININAYYVHLLYNFLDILKKHFSKIQHFLMAFLSDLSKTTFV